MDTITFEIGDTTLQLVNDPDGGNILIWVDGTNREPDVCLPIKCLMDALSTARMLRLNDAA